MNTEIKILDSTDLAEYANAADVPLGVIPLEYGEIADEDFIETVNEEETDMRSRIAFVDSSYLSVGGFYHAEQGLSAVLSSIADCLANQEEHDLSEFIIPISATDRLYLYVCIGRPPSA